MRTQHWPPKSRHQAMKLVDVDADADDAEAVEQMRRCLLRPLKILNNCHKRWRPNRKI